MAVRKKTFILAKTRATGIKLSLQQGLRTRGNRMKLAKSARQQAIDVPDQSWNHGDLAKKPLVLHSKVASRTSSAA